MEERSTKFSLMVTGIFLLGLLVLAALLKPSKESEEGSGIVAKKGTAPLAVTKATVPTSTQQMLPPPNRETPPVPPPGRGRVDESPSVPAEKARQQILTDCQLKPDLTNDGDSFMVKTRSGEYRFSLYFVDAPDLNLGTIEQIRAHSAYFGNLGEEQLHLVARGAREFINKTLATRTFDVVTRWERAPEESPNREVTCRAFVYLKSRNGNPTNLAAMLVDQGLATVCSSVETLPDYSSAEMFMSDLQRLEQTAIAQKRGAWQYSVGQEHTTQVGYRYITR